MDVKPQDIIKQLNALPVSTPPALRMDCYAKAINVLADFINLPQLIKKRGHCNCCGTKEDLFEVVLCPKCLRKIKPKKNIWETDV